MQTYERDESEIKRRNDGMETQFKINVNKEDRNCFIFFYDDDKTGKNVKLNRTMKNNYDDYGSMILLMMKCLYSR